MKTTKTLTGIALAGALVSAISSCNPSIVIEKGMELNYSNGCKYNYYGAIGNEGVSFTSAYSGHPEVITINQLIVNGPNGTTVVYEDDIGDDLKLETVVVISGNKHAIYSSDEIGYSGLKNWQKQFDDYLAKILIQKQSEIEKK